MSDAERLERLERVYAAFNELLEELGQVDLSARPGTLGVRLLEDGRELCLYPMLFGNTRLCLGWPSLGGYDAGWCFHDTGAAKRALAFWDGDGDPPGYFKRVGE